MTPSPAPTRIHCPHAGHCRGCALIQAPYDQQLTWKRAKLKTALDRYPELRRLEPGGAVPADRVVEYRARAKLVVSGKAIGLYARGTHEVVDIPACRVQSPAVTRVVGAIRANLPLPFELLAIDVRQVDQGVLVTWIVETGVDVELVADAAAGLVSREPAVVGVAVSHKPRDAARLLGSVPQRILGSAMTTHQLAPGDVFEEVSFGSFVQAHPGQASRLYASVQTALEHRLGNLAGVPILELYAGSGALALRLARAGASVTAIESFEPAAKSIARAARAQELSLSAISSSAETALAQAVSVRAVVLNPPRRGLSASVRQALGKLQPEIAVYVSCSPTTLARDLAHLARLGLAAESATPFDMIPLSDAVEALVILTPKLPPAPRILFESERWVAVDKPPFLPTTPQTEHTDSLLARVRELPGLADAAPVHRLDAGTSGVCLFARSPDRVAPVSLALSEGRKYYWALLSGIVRPKGSIQRPLRDGLKRRDATTRYRRERVAGTHSLIQAEPEQGRQHQIRRHFASLGHPVLGDDRYGNARSNRYFAERHGLDRPFLHAHRIELSFGEESVRIEAELAPDLVEVLASLETVETSDPADSI